MKTINKNLGSTLDRVDLKSVKGGYFVTSKCSKASDCSTGCCLNYYADGVLTGNCQPKC